MLVEGVVVFVQQAFATVFSCVYLPGQEQVVGIKIVLLLGRKFLAGIERLLYYGQRLLTLNLGRGFDGAIALPKVQAKADYAR